MPQNQFESGSCIDRGQRDTSVALLFQIVKNINQGSTPNDLLYY